MPVVEQRSRRPERALLVGCGAALAVPALLFGLFAWFVARHTAPRPVTLAELSRRTGVRFPAGVRLVESEYRPPFIGPPCCLFARLEVPRADVDALVDGIPEPREVSVAAHLTAEHTIGYQWPPWWRPEDPQGFTQVQHWSGGNTLLVFISRGNASPAVVYVFSSHS